MQEATERLCHDLGEWAHILTRKDMAFDYDFRSMISVAKDLLAAKSTIERHQQVIDLLMKAVEPFSDAATIYDTAFLYQGDIGILPDSSDVSDLDARFTVGDLRRAREAKVEAEKLLNSTPSTAL